MNHSVYVYILVMAGEMCIRDRSDSCSYQHNHCPDPWFSCGLCYSEIRRKAVSSVNRFGAVSENDSYV